MFNHVVLALKRESYEKQWLLIVTGFPWSDKKGQREILEEARRIGKIGTVRKKPWQMVDDIDTAIDMIGLDIKIHGTEWLEKHPQERAFLLKHGVSPEEAVRRHEEWKKRFEAQFRKNGEET